MKVSLWSCALGVGLLGGCGFSPAGAPLGDDDGVEHDAAPDDGGSIDARVMTDAPGPPDIVYLDPAHESPGTGDWVVGEGVDLDTDLNPASPGVPGLPAGVTFTVQPQGAANARPILVLHVRRLELRGGGTFFLYGSRAFAIVAGAEVVVAGRIDASAAAAAPGPGGYSGTAVVGSGGGGTVPANGNSDSGGGGGGHGTGGGRGGGVECADTCTVAPGGGGSPFNDSLFYLSGGGRGGVAPTRTSCIARPPGAGGGGVLVYSPTSISVTGTGVITANGGGGGGGPYCPSIATLAGSGGGAGGQIELQAPTITIAAGGLVVANGGAGGGGANNTGAANAGDDGGDGAESLAVATGGGTGGGTGGTGGPGSIGAGPGGNGGNVALGANGGGGGGGAGRITLRHRNAPPAVTTSPPARYATY